MRNEVLKTDLCVIGGGPAGISAAIAAARTGIKVVLIHNRPVLGGNHSSEIRVGISGAQSANKRELGIVYHPGNRETGIIEELQLENFYYNRALKYSVWDHVLLFTVLKEKNISLFLDCVCLDAECENKTIKSIKAYQMTSETWYTVTASWFADCSGDGILAPLTGAAFMLGHESKEEFGESLGKERADEKVMGSSILIQLRETGRKQEFIAPPWAYKFEEKDLEGKIHTVGQNFWWIEYGGNMDIIHDNEKTREELIRIAYGVWDHVKNSGDHGYANWQLEWVGSLPGKRESRRYVGRYILTQNDVEAGGHFDDIVAYGGWTMDSHHPDGFYFRGRCAINYPTPSPWGIPLRSLYHRDIKNLVFAGRNLSATHLGMSSARIMGQCHLMGQAVGTAAALAVQSDKDFDNLDVSALQQRLMFDDSWLPGKKRNVSPLTLSAKTNAEITRSGIDRGEENCWKGREGDFIELILEKAQKIKGIRIVFDSNLTRSYHNMRSHEALDAKNFLLPETLIKEYRIEAFGPSGEKYEIEVKDNHQRLVIHEAAYEIQKICLIPKKSWGDSVLRVFGFEIF